MWEVFFKKKSVTIRRASTAGRGIVSYAPNLSTDNMKLLSHTTLLKKPNNDAPRTSPR